MHACNVMTKGFYLQTFDEKKQKQKKCDLLIQFVQSIGMTTFFKIIFGKCYAVFQKIQKCGRNRF